MTDFWLAFLIFWLGFFVGTFAQSLWSLITTTSPERAMQNLRAWRSLLRRRG